MPAPTRAAAPLTGAQFQTFDDATDLTTVAPRVAALRAELARRGLDGFIVPRADRHQNEYVAPGDERLAWLTSFTGSAGAAIVLAAKAAIFVDGRYTLQVREQTDIAVFDAVPIADTSIESWIEANLPAGAKLGFDPWLHTVDGADRLRKAGAAAKAELVAVATNPIDTIWTDRPPPPLGAVHLHDIRFAGEAATKKLERLHAELSKTDALLVSDPHAVAWLFNIRGSDVAHTPLPLAFAIVPRNGRAQLYIDNRKLADEVGTALRDLVDLHPPEALEKALGDLGKAHASVLLDQATAADAAARIISAHGGQVTRGADPIALMKAQKNATEIAGSRAAHARDGAAVARFLAWLEVEAPTGKLTEIDAVEALEAFRRDTGVLKDISFPTISGAGEHGAIVHYRVNRATNRAINSGDLVLIDSGAQYDDGTTDITRTVIVGDPSPEQRDRFTRVLKGHIAIARLVFPDGTTGAQLDSFARQYLWAAGLDFDHGTGHGVGSYLSVHEGPARISKLGTTPLKRGMILSNEPGYYKTGAYGIRIESLVLVIVATVAGAEKHLNAFETLTLAPIDLRLVDAELMTREELDWLDAYHARVRDTLSPLVDGPTRAWLDTATRPLRG